LNAAKLKVLAKSAGAAELTPLGFPGGAAASGDRTFWVLGDEIGANVLGPALMVALRADPPVERLVAITDDANDAAVVARRAAQFARPATIDVASVTGTTLTFCASAATSDVAAHAQNELNEFADVIRAAGAEAVWEHGVLTAEVRGLEIARVEHGELAVGVGKHDREGHRMANADRDPAAALLALADRVRLERTADAPAGLMTSVGRERWLRSIVIAHPDMVGATELVAVQPPLPRVDLRATSIAPAVGEGIVVACSVGIDPNLVPAAADVRAQHGRDSELVLVVPEGDDAPSTHLLASALKRPARVVTVPGNWPALGD
jgi:hypothetical protein